jgi:hypothetical protein
MKTKTSRIGFFVWALIIVAAIGISAYGGKKPAPPPPTIEAVPLVLTMNDGLAIISDAGGPSSEAGGPYVDGTDYVAVVLDLDGNFGFGFQVMPSDVQSTSRMIGLRFVGSVACVDSNDCPLPNLQDGLATALVTQSTNMGPKAIQNMVAVNPGGPGDPPQNVAYALAFSDSDDRRWRVLFHRGPAVDDNNTDFAQASCTGNGSDGKCSRWVLGAAEPDAQALLVEVVSIKGKSTVIPRAYVSMPFQWTLTRKP